VPKINALVEKYADRSDVVFISITDEQPEKTKSTLKKIDFKSIVASDAYLTTHKNYIMDDEGGYSIPRNFLIDQNGIVRWTGISMKLNPELFAKFLANEPIEVEDETPFDIPSPTFTK
jgi:peroxiredoxin